MHAFISRPIAQLGYASARDVAVVRYPADARVLRLVTRGVAAAVFVPSLLAMLLITALLLGLA